MGLTMKAEVRQVRSLNWQPEFLAIKQLRQKQTRAEHLASNCNSAELPKIEDPINKQE